MKPVTTLFDRFNKVSDQSPQPKLRKRRSDAGLPRTKVQVQVPLQTVQPEVQQLSPVTNVQHICPWTRLVNSIAVPDVVLPATGALLLSVYVAHEGYGYLSTTNTPMSALLTAITAEAVMITAACAHSASKGFTRLLLTGLMVGMVVSGAMYMHSGVSAQSTSSSEVHQRAKQAREGTIESLRIAREGVDQIPASFATKRSEAMKVVTALETKLAEQDSALLQSSNPPVGVTYNLLVRLCAMILALILVHVACTKCKQQ